MKKIVLFVLLMVVVGCGFGNSDDVRKHAAETWQQNGFSVVGYQGYEFGPVVPFTSYGGAYVWYRIKREPDNGIVYQGAIQRWGKEYHVYSLSAIDALKPNK